LSERAARVDGLIRDIQGRLKTVEDELNDEDPAEGADRVDSGLDKPVGLGSTEGLGVDGADDGYVNIGDAKPLVAAIASEAHLPKESEPGLGEGIASAAAQSVHAHGKLGPSVQSSFNASKGTLRGQVARKSGSRKPGAPSGSQGQSAVASSSKSPGGKLKKRNQAGLDAEAKAALKVMDTKIEELRKQTFGNVNRLDAKLDGLQAESKQA
jgi:hypothetical protein